MRIEPRSRAVALAVAAAVLSLAGCSGQRPAADSSRPAPVASVKQSAVLRQGGSFDGGGDPAGDSLGTLLDKALGRSGMHAAVYGQIISDGAAKDEPSSADGSPEVVTDYSFRVDAVFGKGPSVAYSRGDTITIRIPGGETATKSVSMEDSPRLSKGDQLVVFDQDQGLVAHDSRTIVLLTSANLGTVSGSSITFQKGVISFNEARDRLNSHPAQS